MIGGVMSRPQAILQMSKLVQIAGTSSSRNIHSTALRASVTDSKSQVAPVYAKIRAKQEKFQLDDGVPVHFKGGPMDRVFYYITLVMLAAGLAGSVQFIYGQAYPKK